jgi:hypothetical protein
MNPHSLIVVASPYDPNDNTQPENKKPRNTNSVSPNHHKKSKLYLRNMNYPTGTNPH